MKRLFGLTLLATTTLSVAAFAAPERIRGTIESISADSIVVHPATGADVTIAVGADTKYAKVTKSTLDSVEKGSYIGTATKGAGANLVALEVVVFAPALRGVGDGHYDWDKMSDTTLSGKHTTASSMTNGNVDTAMSASGGKTVSSTMTNGNVDTSADKSGAKQLVVSYKGGSQKITVPPTAPIVLLEPADMSIAMKGDPVFIIGNADGGKVAGGLVAVGKGVVPPM